MRQKMWDALYNYNIVFLQNVQDTILRVIIFDLYIRAEFHRIQSCVKLQFLTLFYSHPSLYSGAVRKLQQLE